jgi:hypothetical protein
MMLYLVSKHDSEGQRLWLHFFLCSALALVARLTNAEEWKLEKNPSPWKREDANGNMVWRASYGAIVEIVPLKLFFRAWSVKRWIRKRLHWQNLNEKGREDVKGSILRNGRAWFKPFTGNRRHELSFNCQWVLWSKRISVGLGLADYENAVSFHICLYLFSFYFNLEYSPLERWLEEKTKRKDEKYGNGRTIGFTWMEGSLMVDLWNDPMEWRSRDPKWQSFSINPMDILLGRRKHASRTLAKEMRLLTMPEKAYPVVIELKEDSWKRPRWLWPDKIVRAHIEIEGGVPVPGKGENSYDCGEDATYGLTCPAKSFDEALSKLYATVMQSRERYGGRNWKPESVAA